MPHDRADRRLGLGVARALGVRGVREQQADAGRAELAEPGEVGAYVDPMHMTIEGGRAGWEMGLDLVAPWLVLVGVKNFRWLLAERDAQGQLRWRWEYCPLADGQAPLPESGC